MWFQPDTYVIFLTEKDEIGANLPIYHIRRYIEELGQVFGDGTHILYVNGAKRKEDSRTPLGDLVHDFFCTDVDSIRNEVIRERVRYFKEKKEGMREMCQIMEELRTEGLEEGLEKGREEGRIEGRTEGLLEGHSKGLAEGHTKGRIEGREETLKGVVKSMLVNGGFTVPEVADAIGIPLEEVQEIQALLVN